MNSREQNRQRAYNEHVWEQLATSVGGRRSSGGGRGGGGKVAAAASPPPAQPSLKDLFNRAAKDPQLKIPNHGISSKIQIEMLKQKMSQPRANCSYSPMGTVTNAKNPKRDRWIMETIAALTAQMKARQGVNKEFNRVAKTGVAKQAFNQASLGRKR